MPTSDNDPVVKLGSLAATLAEEVNDLSAGTKRNVADLAQQTEKTRHMVWVLAFSITLDVLLTVILGFGLVKIQDNATSITAIQDRLTYNQSVQRQKALCPLYQLFKDSWNTPEKKAAALARSTDKPGFEKAIRTIDEGYEALKCSDFKGKAPELGR